VIYFFEKKNFGQKIQYFKNENFRDACEFSKMDKTLSNNKKKRFFRVQRIRINNLSALVQNLVIFL
jgi:hypothetical protein